MIGAVRDLPLSADASSRFLPWIVGGMVYLAALALAASMFVSSTGSDWRRGLSSSVTVQVMPASDVDGARAAQAAFNVRTKAALKLLRETPGVTGADLLTDAKVRSLIEPWLGEGAASVDLPLPRLIDVSLADETPVDTSALATRLASAVPGATLDDHGLWLTRLLAVARTVEIVAICVMLLIGASAAVTVVFITRTGLAIHYDIVEVLHLIGARDSYVSRQFELHALWLSLNGGAVGVLLAAATLGVLQYVGAGLEASMLPGFSLSVLQWLALAALPVIGALISVATARLTVMRTLGRMM